jgi:dihydroorotate dehydrogenase (NAD+) catalytic subunit
VSAPELGTRLGDVDLPTPVLTASGCAVAGRELERFLDPTTLGGFVTRTVTLDPEPGAPMPRMLETPSGVLAAVGRHNPGLQGFLATELPWLAQRGVRTIASVRGSTLAEWGELGRRLGQSPGVLGIELNLAGMDPLQAGKAVHVVGRDVPRGVVVLAKLDPGTAVDAARAAADNGAHAVVVGHGFPGLVIDPATLRPALGAGPGTLSGPAVHALALRTVWEVHAALADLPVVGVGGIRTGFDVLAMLAAGASAVQVGSVLFRDPSAPTRILAELTGELASRGIARSADVVGRAHQAPDEGDSR